MKEYQSLIPSSDYRFSDDTYKRWVTVRVSIYTAIEQLIIKGLKCDRVVIFGAGSCMDLPMDYLFDKFNEIVLVDNNVSELNDSKKFTIQYERKIKRIVSDITGLNKIMPKESSLNDFFNKLEKKINLNYIPDELKHIGKFSLIISDLLISQLHLPYIDYAIDNYSNFTSKYTDNFISLLSEQHCQQLSYYKDLNGSILTIQDLIVAGEENGKPYAFNNIIMKNKFIVDNPTLINQYELANWIVNYGVKGYFINTDIFPSPYKKYQFWWWCQTLRWYLCELNIYYDG